MATSQKEQHASEIKRRRDNADGWERGAFSPYPKDKEEQILANIEKVSLDFVKGYREGKNYIARSDYDGRD